MPNKIVLIGGMGRSGTHYLGRILGEHPQTILRLESKFTFKSITQYVVFRGERHRLLVWLALAYLKIKSMLTQKHIIEKTHPAIWIKDKIDFISPEAKWICVVRDPYQAIASMKKHAGVQAWYDRVSLSEHNDFLGITAQNVSQFGQLSLVQKGAFKWIAHMNQMEQIKNDSPDRVLIVHFDDLVQRQAQTLNEVFQFLDLSPIEPREKGNAKTLRKKQALKPAEVNEIDEILRSHNRAEWMKYRPEE